MARKHGAVRVDESYSYYEKFWHYELSQTVGNGGSMTIPNIGTFSLPWAGQAFITMTLFAVWNGYQNAAPVLTASPGLSYAPQFNTTEDSAGGGNTWKTIPLYGNWVSLAANQTVTVGVVLVVGGGGPSVSFYRVGGSVRGYPT